MAPAAAVVASAAGGSQVDPVHDHNRYRYVAVAGPLGMSRPALITAELRALAARGWGQERSVGFRPGTTVLQPVPVTATGAEVLVNAPSHQEYAAMSLLGEAPLAAQQTARSPLAGNPAIGDALTRGQPVLWVVLGRGSHP